MKTCSKCGAEKPLDAFYRQSSCPDGRRPDCKVCRNATQSAYAEANRERIRVSRAQHYAENRERLLAAQADYYAQNKERVLASVAAYRLRNPERIRTYMAEYGPAYYAANKERLRDVRNAHYQANQQQYAERDARRRARLLEATVEEFSREDLLAYWEQQGLSSCVYCPDGEFEQIDHVVPLARGGSHSLDNLVPACERCNKSKGSKLLEDWLAERQARLDA